MNTKNKFELTISWIENDYVQFYQTHNYENLIELLARFQLTVGQLQEKVKETELDRLKLERVDNDIPF